MKAIGAVLLFLAASTPAGAQADCSPARCVVQTAVDLRCPCTEATARGEYLRCATTVVKELVAEGTISVACKHEVRHCVRRSICGRPVGAVVCDVPKVSGACAIGLGFCHHPDGSILYTHPCSSDDDCVLESRCMISRSAEHCLARGRHRLVALEVLRRVHTRRGDTLW